MEAFSLLKYWRGGGGGGVSPCLAGNSGPNVRTRTGTASTTTIVTAVSRHSSETDEEENDDGPFFDLEFTVPDEDEGDEQARNYENDGSNSTEDNGDDFDGSDGEDETELKFTLSSNSSGDGTDPNISLSPSDDLFFKGCLVPVEPSSLAFSNLGINSKPQFPVSLLKSATKFRVMMLKFKKFKSNNVSKNAENTYLNGAVTANTKSEQKQPPQKEEEQSQANGKFCTVKFKVEEVPIVSLFTRENSSKVANNKGQKQNTDELASDEKRFSKEAMQRYLRKVKPLYVRVSKRYGEKLRFSGQLNLSGAAKAGLARPTTTTEQKSAQAAKNETEMPEATEAPPQGNVKGQKQGSLPAGLRVVCKHLGKSRSASSTVAAAPSGGISSERRDDSLLQQQDGIQSAILHCKRSFKASRDTESSILARSVSDASQEKCVNVSTDSSSKEAKENISG